MRKIGLIVLLALLGTLLNVATFPGTSMARVFRVFGPESFTRSMKEPATQVRQFLVQYPRAYDFTLHIFYKGIKENPAGITPDAVVVLNGEQVVTHDDFIQNSGYLRKPITLTDVNSLSVEHRGKRASGIRIVITARNDEPLAFNFQNIIHPDGSKLFGPGLRYNWNVIKKPDGGNVTLNLATDRSSPELFVDLPGEYALELVVSFGLWWKSEPIPIRLLATEATPSYPDYIPVPVRTRVVLGDGSQYGNYYIEVGNTTYPAPAPTACGSPSNSGFQVLVLDRASLTPKYQKSFNVPCGNSSMVNFLNTLDNTSLVIVSSLNNATPNDVCGSSSSCPLGAKLIEFGATNIFTANYSSTLNYMVDKTSVKFSYSLIGVRGLGQDQGIELNDWDHRVTYKLDNDGLKRMSSSIEGSFVKDANPSATSNWTFVYPEFIEIDTHTGTTTAGNTIMVGTVPYQSTGLPTGATGAFQAVQLFMDTLSPPLQPPAYTETYFTNSGTGTGSVSESEQKRLLDDLNYMWYPGARFITVITTFGTPIDYKSVYFSDMIKTIGNDLGGTIGILNDLGTGATYSYSLIGMSKPTSDTNPVPYPLGAADTVDAMSPTASQEHNLRVVMHKDKQGWFKPAIKYTQALADTSGGPDFSLVSVALQPSVPWPLPDPSLPTSDPTYQEQLRAYQFISSHVNAGIGVTDIRSMYVGASDNDALLWWTACLDLSYTNIPSPTFSQQVFTDMKNQVCGDYANGIPGEFDYVRVVSAFKEDMDTALVNMQVGSNNNMTAVYQTVRDAVPVKDTDKVKYNAVLVVRGILIVATAVVPVAPLKATMGALNATLMIATAISKNSQGADYTAIDTQYQNLQTQMNGVWGNCTTGTHKLVSIIKSDWGKLQYVGRKFMLPLDTPPADGGPGWQYDRTNDPDNWKSVVTNSLQAYYLQSLMPAVWNIDYMLDSTKVSSPGHFGYTQYDRYNIKYYCTPYCMQISSNPNADQVDSLSSGSSWYVLTSDGMFNDKYCTPCACVRYDDSATVRDILFGEGSWDAGEKLQLDQRLFYERWLPSSVYRLPLDGDLGSNYYSTNSCSYWGP